MKVNKLSLRIIAVLILAVAILSVFQQRLDIIIDTNTVLLIGFALLAFLLPEVSNLSKLRYGNIELEFEKKVNHLEKMVIAEESTSRTKPVLKTAKKSGWQEYDSEYKNILSSRSSNIEKILRASQLVERMIESAADDFGLAEGQQFKSPTSTMVDLHKHKFISDDELALYNEFYSLRNKIIHGEISEISDQLTARILDLLWRIVRIFG